MFGSLVVVLPTVHEGGALIFRHNGEEHTFDTARVVSSPQIFFVAFYSDVEHEVSVVTAGYRVTLTYNLYLVDSPSPKRELGLGPDHGSLARMKIALESLLADPKFLHKGGLLGFGLSHKYPFNPNTTTLGELEGRLKGSDARTWSLCKALSLNVSLKAVYSPGAAGDMEWEEYWQDVTCLLDHFADLDAELMSGKVVEDEIMVHLQFGHDGAWFHDVEGSRNVYEVPPILWVKPRGKSNTFEQTYMAHGNEASPDHAYGEVCLVAEIGKFEKRKKRRSIWDY
jgi:hypothetical protein